MRIYTNRDYYKNCVECGNRFLLKYKYRFKNIQRCSITCAVKGRKGRLKSEEHKLKIKLSNIGKPHPKWHDDKIRVAKHIANRKGKYMFLKFSEDERKEIYRKIRLANIGRLGKRGSQSHFWKGGISKENHILRNRGIYKNWRRKVFERDNYTCQMCYTTNVQLHAHHVKSFSNFPELRYDISNGMTLCAKCHRLTDSYARKIKIN